MIKYECNECHLMSEQPLESYEVCIRRYSDEPESVIKGIEVHLCKGCVSKMSQRIMEAATSDRPY